MMNSFLLSRKDIDYSSIVWHRSQQFEGVSFAIRRPSLEQRIEMTSRVRDLTLKHEFLKAGDIADQLAASLSELLVSKLYLQWGLAEIKGLKIDGEQASVINLIERGPERLIEEIIGAIKAESALTEDERKNS
jgi:hypothetical protein